MQSIGHFDSNELLLNKLITKYTGRQVYESLPRVGADVSSEKRMLYYIAALLQK